MPKEPLNEEYLTVNQIATIANVTPQAVYKRFNNPTLSAYIKIVGNTKYIHRSALKDIYHIGQEDTHAEQQQQLITLLQEQLRVKDKQIADLTEALKAEQILRATADKRIALLEDRAADSQNKKPDVDQTSAPQTDQRAEQTPEAPAESPADQTTEDATTEQTQQKGFLDWLKGILGL